jgi:hypothetical protein
MPADLHKYFQVQPIDPDAKICADSDADSNIQARSTYKKLTTPLPAYVGNLFARDSQL